jgi:hypothetical protein
MVLKKNPFSEDGIYAGVLQGSVNSPSGNGLILTIALMGCRTARYLRLGTGRAYGSQGIFNIFIEELGTVYS